MPPLTSSPAHITIYRPADRTPDQVRVIHARSRRPLDWIRLAFAVLLFAIALLTALPAPTRSAWLVGLVAGEGGHWLAPVALLTLIPGWRSSAPGRIAGVLGLAAAALFAIPLIQALRMEHEIRSEVARTFGQPDLFAAPGAEAREKPIEFLDLFAGIPVGKSRMRTVAYATDADGERRLDLYLPLDSTRTAPLLVVVHGGSWRAGDRAELTALSRYFAARGVAVAMPDYRLAPAHRWPVARDDVLAATAFLQARASTLGIDGSRVAFLGRSAGAQLALAAALSPSSDSTVRGAVSLYGPLDLRWGYANPGNPRVLDGRAVLRDYLGGTPDEVPARYDAASPIAMVDRNTPPVLLVHGERDDMVSPAHAGRFDARMEWAGRRHLTLLLPWATHGCDAILRGPCGQITLYATERFLADVLR